MRALLLMCLVSASAFAQVTKTTVTVSFPNCTGSTPASYDVDVYRPSGTGPFALVGIGHGFQNSKANHEVLARARGKRCRRGDSAVPAVPRGAVRRG
jgi:hypothetical protein